MVVFVVCKTTSRQWRRSRLITLVAPLEAACRRIAAGEKGGRGLHWPIRHSTGAVLGRDSFLLYPCMLRAGPWRLGDVLADMCLLHSLVQLTHCYLAAGVIFSLNHTHFSIFLPTIVVGATIRLDTYLVWYDNIEA